MVAASEATARLIQDNWQRVQQQVAEACRSAARDPAEVRIVGVSKYVGPELTYQLFQAGCQLLGENRPQALWAKHEYFQQQSAATTPAAWHLIGHLQRNKLRRTLPLLDYLHSLDSQRLATAVDQEALSQGRRLPVLVEVNVTRDSAKTGLPADELPTFLERLAGASGLQLGGLMAMSSHWAGADEARREFDQVRELRDRLQTQFPELDLHELSMGMSGDYAPAIAAGATLVRIGSSLWEGIL